MKDCDHQIDTELTTVMFNYHHTTSRQVTLDIRRTPASKNFTNKTDCISSWCVMRLGINLLFGNNNSAPGVHTQG